MRFRALSCASELLENVRFRALSCALAHMENFSKTMEPQTVSLPLGLVYPLKTLGNDAHYHRRWPWLGQAHGGGRLCGIPHTSCIRDLQGTGGCPSHTRKGEELIAKGGDNNGRPEFFLWNNCRRYEL